MLQGSEGQEMQITVKHYQGEKQLQQGRDEELRAD